MLPTDRYLICFQISHYFQIGLFNTLMSRPIVSNDNASFFSNFVISPDSNSSSSLHHISDQSLNLDQTNNKSTSSHSPTGSPASTSAHLSPNSCGDVAPSSSSPTEKRSKKTRIPANPRTPPKLTSLSPKSSSFRVATQPAPKSPRQLKEPKELPYREKKSNKTSKDISHSSRLKEKIISPTKVIDTASSTSSTNLSDITSSPLRLICRTEKKEIPSALLKKLSTTHTHRTLINLLVDDICSGSLSLDNRHAIGRTDSAFYAEKLPAVLRPYVKDLNQATISSSKLLLNLFSSEFHKNLGWANAKILYANFIFQEKNKPQIVIGEDNFAVKNAERARLKGFAEVVSKAIFGHPATIKNSPLPKILIDDLIYADQYFYEKLLTHPVTQNWSIEQMQDARYALQKLLSVTRLLMPMFTVLADKKPSQQEIWCLGLILQTLLSSASELSKEILVASFSDADPSLQKRVQEKEKLERIQNRTKTFKTKTLPRHTRSRSADTTPIDLKSLMSPQAARKKRALEKTGQVVADLLFADDSFDKVLDEGMKAIEENDEIRRVQAYIKDLSLDDLAEIEQMLADRDEQELIGLIPDGEFKPERAQPLPESTADLSTPIFSEDNDPSAELAESTLSEPIQADDSSKALGKEKNNEVFEKNEVNRESDVNQEIEFHENTELTEKISLDPQTTSDQINQI